MITDLRNDRYDQLPREKQQQLARKARSGDQEAYVQLCESNVRYAMKRVHRYRWANVPEQDLEGAALLGLCLGLREYDPDRHKRPIGYVKSRIRDQIRKCIRKHGRTVRLPHHQRVRLRKIDRAREELRQELYRAPKASEIAGEIDGLTTEQVVDALRRRYPSDSMDELFQEDDDANGRTYLDVMRDADVPMPDVEYESEELNTIIDRLLGYLPDRQGKIIRLMLGANVDRTSGQQKGHLVLPSDIAEHFDVGLPRVQQLKREALRTLQEWAEQLNLSPA